jgi:predicted RNA-binding protein
MCEAKVYLEERGETRKVMDLAVRVEEEGGRVVVYGMLGERKEFEGFRIARIDVERHEVLLRRDGGSG